MPSARLPARTASRRVVLLAMTAALAAVLVSLVSTETGSACGGPPPKPLRALYTESDLVVVARVGRTVPVEMVPVDGQPLKVYLMRTSLRVNSTVKGQGNHGVIPLYHLSWQSDDAAETLNQFGEYGDADKLLFFLKRRADGEGYEEADSSYGVKKLSDADLRVYVERMNELALILQQEKPDPARIMEWIVRCAEEPATRWEGLYELLSSKYAAQSIEDEEKEKEKAAAAEGEAAEDGGEEAGGAAGEASLNHGGPPAEGAAEAEAAEAEGGEANTDPRLGKVLNTRETFYTPDPELVGLLTAEQKKRLADLLFNADQLPDGATTLIELVKDWHDPRFVPFALARLRSFGDEPPPIAADLMTALAESLGDEGLMRLAASYSEKSTYYDEEAEEDVATVTSERGESPAEEEAEEDPAEKAFEESLVGNSAQKRKLRLHRFIARAEVALAN